MHKEDCDVLQTVRDSAKDDSISLPVEDKGEHVFALMQRGIRLLQKGDAAAAERDFRALLEKGFHQVGAYSNLGSALLMQGRCAEAIPYLEKAVTLKPLEGRYESRIAYELLGQAHQMIGNIADAESTYKKALEKFPGDQQLCAMLERL